MTEDEEGANGPKTTSPEDAISLIANETRLGIIRVLGDKYTEEGPVRAVTWSELREEVAPSMDSGRFNYHLDQLVGPFVQRAEDGYRLRLLGMQLYRPLAAAMPNDPVTMDSIELNQTCYFCSGHLIGQDSDGVIEIECSSCGHLYEAMELPRQAIKDKEPSTVLRRVDRRNRQYLLAYTDGICPHCVSAIKTRWYLGSEVSYEKLSHREALIYAACMNCPSRIYLPVGEWVLYHPALVMFCYQRGLNVIEQPLWELPFTATDRGVAVDSTDPWKVEFQVELQDETLQMVLNEDFEVTDTTVS